MALPLGPLNTDTSHGRLIATYAEMVSLYHCGGDLNKYIFTCLGVGLLPLGGKAASLSHTKQ